MGAKYKKISLVILWSAIIVAASWPWASRYFKLEAVREAQTTVLYVPDGDSFSAKLGSTKTRIRIRGVDAPEEAQSYGPLAKKFLSDLALGKTVILKNIQEDTFGRALAEVYLIDTNSNALKSAAEQDIAKLLIEAGMGWEFLSNVEKSQDYKNLEKQAREEKRGIWIQQNPIPPWIYREQTKSPNIKIY